MRSLTSVRTWRPLRTVGRAFASAPPWLILAIGIGITFLYAHPGLMSQDSFDLLGEARRGVYTDGHPPVLSAIWRVIDLVIAGQLGMLLLQIIPFPLGLYLVIRRALAPKPAAWAATLTFLYPPIWCPMGVIWKDSLMAACLIVGFAAMFSERRKHRILGLLALMLASAVRYNALAATLPIVILLFTWSPDQRPLRRYAIATAAWLAITFGAFTANAYLTTYPMHIWHSSLAVHDIVGTMSFVDGEPSDAEMEKLVAGTDIKVHTNIHAAMRALYTPRDFFPVINGREGQPALWELPIYGTTPAPLEQRTAIARTWWDVITTYPLAYLEHRLGVMREVLCLGETRRPLSAITRRDLIASEQSKNLGLATTFSVYQKRASRWMYGIWRWTPLFVPWIYLVLTLILLPLTRKHRDVFVLLLSGLMLEGTLLVLAPSPDYRYSHWMVVCTVVGAVMLTVRRSREKPAAPTPSAATPR